MLQLLLQGPLAVTAMNEGPTWWQNLNDILKKERSMNVWGRAREGKGADGEKLRGWGCHRQSSLFPSDSLTSRMVTHWDLLRRSYMQSSPVLPCRGANLSLGQRNPMGNTSPVVPAGPRKQRHLWRKSEEKVRNSIHSSLPIKKKTNLRNLSL